MVEEYILHMLHTLCGVVVVAAAAVVVVAVAASIWFRDFF